MQYILGIIIGALLAGSLFYLYRSYSPKRKTKLSQKISLIALSVVFLALFIFIPFGFQQIETGEIAVVKEWGKATGTRSAGLHFRNIISETYEIYDLKTQQLDFDTEVYTKDAQTLSVQLTIQFSIKTENVINIATTFGNLSNLKDRVGKVAIEKAKVILAAQSAMELIETRGALSPKVYTEIKALESQYYIFVENVVIVDMAFNSAFEQAVEQKMIAEQEKLKATYDMETALIKAQEQLEVARLKAEEILILAKGEADALTVMQQAWAQLSPDVRAAMLQQMFYEKWDGKLPQVLGGDYSLIFPINP